MENIIKRYVAAAFKDNLINSMFYVFYSKGDAEVFAGENNHEIVKKDFQGDKNAWVNDPCSGRWIVMSWDVFKSDYQEAYELAIYLEEMSGQCQYQRKKL